MGRSAWSQMVLERGMLIEYCLKIPPLMLNFEFNPQSISRTRTATIPRRGDGKGCGGYGFSTESDTQRASQGVTVEPEQMTITILLDATDRMNVGDETASFFGVQPEIDIIYSMLEPRNQLAEGARVLSSLGADIPKAFSRQESSPVLLFKWGIQVLPVFMTQAQIEGKEFLPSLHPYRAEASLTLQVIESTNPFYEVERKRRLAYAMKHMGQSVMTNVNTLLNGA